VHLSFTTQAPKSTRKGDWTKRLRRLTTPLRYVS
jgi:hypothetical protein